MSVATLLELAAELPFDDLTYMDEEVSQITGGFFCSMQNPDPDVISRIKAKTVFSITQNDGKYGEVATIYYLDGEAAVLVKFGGKWLSPLAAYVINPEVHKKLVGIIAEHHVATMVNLDTLSDQYLTTLGSQYKRYLPGDPLDKEHFPVKINKDHVDYIR